MRLPVRQPVARGSVRPRRSASWLVRAVGAVLALMAAAGIIYVIRTDAFSVESISVSGLVYTDEQTVLATVGMEPGYKPSVFQLSPSEMAEALRGLPSVESADVDASLPNRLDIKVHERQPLFVWRTPNEQLLVDTNGVLLAHAPSLGGLPVVYDLRQADIDLSPGDIVDSIDMAAARLLLTITPAEIGSAQTLALGVDDEHGWYMDGTPPPPFLRAVFGFYSANVRKPADLIPRQRQCLASLLAARPAATMITIYLAVDGDRCGTYREEPTPSGYSGQNVGGRAT